jgi:hypothetical protein
MSSESDTSGLSLLNRVLEARWLLECAADEEKAEAMSRLNRVLDEAISGRPDLSREDIMQALRDPWRDYCRKKKKFG